MPNCIAFVRYSDGIMLLRLLIFHRSVCGFPSEQHNFFLLQRCNPATRRSLVASQFSTARQFSPEETEYAVRRTGVSALLTLLISLWSSILLNDVCVIVVCQIVKHVTTASDVIALAREVRIARWCLGRTLWSLQRATDALALQEDLLAEWETSKEDQDGYVFEEIAECLLTLGRAAESQFYFAQAYARFRQNIWLVIQEKERLERLKQSERGSQPSLPAWYLACLGALLLCLLALVLGIETVRYTSTPWRVFRDPIYEYTLSYPPSWLSFTERDGSHLTLYPLTRTTVNPIITTQSGSPAARLYS